MIDTFKPGPDAVEIIEREECFRGFYRLDRLHLRHRQFSGEMGPTLSRELFVRHDAVCVLPYDPQRDQVVLIEQFRVGAMQKSANPWMLELVAGLIDKDEEPDEVARREAVEEADLTLTSLWPITAYYPSPGDRTNTCTCTSVVATAAAPVACTGWPRRARTSASTCCPSPMRWLRCVTAASSTPPPSSPCNGWH